MSLTESTVEQAALEWFGEQTRCAHTLTPALCHGEREKGERWAAFAWLRRAKPEMAPGEAAAERESFGEVVLEGRLHREFWVVPFEFHPQSSP